MKKFSFLIALFSFITFSTLPMERSVQLPLVPLTDNDQGDALEQIIPTDPLMQTIDESSKETEATEPIKSSDTEVFEQKVIDSIQRLQKKLKQIILQEKPEYSNFFANEEKLITPRDLSEFYHRLLNPTNVNENESQASLVLTDEGMRNKFILSNTCAIRLRQACAREIQRLNKHAVKMAEGACVAKACQIIHCYFLPATMFFMACVCIYLAVDSKSIQPLVKIFLSKEGIPVYLLLLAYFGLGLTNRVCNGGCCTPFCARNINASNHLEKSLEELQELNGYFADRKLQMIESAETLV